MGNTLVTILLVMLAGVVWAAGAMLQWGNLQRQERLVALLWLMYLRQRPAEAEEEPTTVALGGEPLGERLRVAKRWSPDS
jgi:hypothetical protein